MTRTQKYIKFDQYPNETKNWFILSHFTKKQRDQSWPVKLERHQLTLTWLELSELHLFGRFLFGRNPTKVLFCQPSKKNKEREEEQGDQSLPQVNDVRRNDHEDHHEPKVCDHREDARDGEHLQGDCNAYVSSCVYFLLF